MPVPDFEPRPRLPQTAISAVGFYFRTFVQAAVMATLLSLPILLVIHTISPLAATYGLLGLISFVFVAPFGMLSKSERFKDGEETLERLKEELSAREVFLLVVGLNTPAFWTVITMSALFGAAGIAAGYPFLAIIGAIVAPMIDNEIGIIHEYLSPSILVRMFVFELMEALGFIRSDLASEAKRPEISYSLVSV